jgi:hypothetical protein
MAYPSLQLLYQQWQTSSRTCLTKCEHPESLANGVKINHTNSRRKWSTVLIFAGNGFPLTRILLSSQKALTSRLSGIANSLISCWVLLHVGQCYWFLTSGCSESHTAQHMLWCSEGKSTFSLGAYVIQSAVLLNNSLLNNHSEIQQIISAAPKQYQPQSNIAGLNCPEHVFS